MSWTEPSASGRVALLTDALSASGATAAQFCNFMLKGDAGEATEKPSRKGVVYLQIQTDTIVAEGMPMFADIVYMREVNGTEEKQGAKLIVSSVRKIPGSNLSAITLVDVDKVKDATPMNVYFQSFKLELAPQCVNTNNADVIATFISRDKDAKKYHEWVEQGNAQENLDLTDVGNQLTALTNFFQTAFTSVSCPSGSELVDGTCQEMLESAALKVGKISTFPMYLRTTAQFQMDFATAVDSLDEWVKDFSTFFIVDQPSYESLQKREMTLRDKLINNKDQCTAQFLLNMHRSIFETYLMQLNNLWQEPNISTRDVSAIMWLLYYTQLPVFVFKLLQMMVPESVERTRIPATMHEIVSAFHRELLKHLTGFLPIRDAENVPQRDLIDTIRMHLERIRVGVQEQMGNELVRKTPTCLSA